MLRKVIPFCRIFCGCICPSSLVLSCGEIVSILSIPQNEASCWELPVSFFFQGSALKCSRLCAFLQSCSVELTVDINVLSVWVCARPLQSWYSPSVEACAQWMRRLACALSGHTQSAGGTCQPIMESCRWGVPWGSWEGLFLVESVNQLVGFVVCFSDPCCGCCETLSLLLAPSSSQAIQPCQSPQWSGWGKAKVAS